MAGLSLPREWRRHRWQIALGIFGAIGIGALGVLLLREKPPFSGSGSINVGTLLPPAAAIMATSQRRSRHTALLLTIMAVILVTITGVILFALEFRVSTLPLAIVLLAISGLSLVSTIRQLRSPVRLLLTEDVIVRSGYLRPSPPIPYRDIVRVDGLPTTGAPDRIALTLRTPPHRANGLLRRLRGYDLAIGHDVGADARVLQTLIEERMPPATMEAQDRPVSVAADRSPTTSP